DRYGQQRGAGRPLYKWSGDVHVILTAYPKPERASRAPRFAGKSVAGKRIAVLFSVACAAALAQDDPTMVFEAASVKPIPEGTPRTMSGCLGGPGSDDPGRINCEYASLKMLLMRAYQMKTQQIVGPAWLDEVHFNINATVRHGATKEQLNQMYRN